MGNKEIRIEQPILSKNDQLAAENLKKFNELGIFAVNIIASPGSGKTSLLEAMAEHLSSDLAVIEGDLQTRRDAERIEKAGCRAVQIETGGSCHLDAEEVAGAVRELDLEGNPCKILAIENVGNLVCPASFLLGEHMKIALLSLPEGDDKVLKYPSIFRRVGVLVITKTDLSPYMDFDIERAVAECESLNDGFDTFRVSAKTGEGVEELCRFLLQKQSALKA